MCAVSAISDNYKDNFHEKYPWIKPWVNPDPYPSEPVIPPTPAPNLVDLDKYATREQIEELRKDLEELKKLIKAAIKYDEATNQPHCEDEQKMDLIRRVAEAVGVDLKDLNIQE